MSESKNWLILKKIKIKIKIVTSLSLAGNSDRFTWIRHSSRKSSVTHSYQCV